MEHHELVCKADILLNDQIASRSLTIGRFLIGAGIGVSAVVVPAYLGEVAPAALRGRIVEAYEVMLCLGMLSAMLVDAALQHAPHNWRLMVGAPIVPAFVLASKSSSLLAMTFASIDNFELALTFSPS